MATTSEGGGKEDLKTQFITREGTYKLMSLSEYSRPNRIGYNAQGTMPVKVSFITLNDPGNGDKCDRTLVVFNVVKELYCYTYKGIRKAADLNKPVDKRVYKGTSPTCHDFNKLTSTSESASLLVGFSAGQVQLIDPIRKETSKLFNEERLIDKSKVTCLRWIPGSTNQFLVAHTSGQMYVYNEGLPCGTTAPHYQIFKQGESYSVHTCKTKTTRNPLYRWVIGDGAICEFEFSPCFKYLAVVSQDGYLRVFNYDTMDYVGGMRSYFGGLLCVSWSPDSKYIVVGGEDDLVTVWSFVEKRVVARGSGHKSYVSVVAFDEYTTVIGTNCDNNYEMSDEDLSAAANCRPNHTTTLTDSYICTVNTSASNRNSTDSQTLQGVPHNLTSYRFGSVGQDTQLCLWDLTEDVIRHPPPRNRTSTHLAAAASSKCNSYSTNNAVPVKDSPIGDGNLHTATVSTSLTHKFASLTLGDKKDKEHKRHFSLASKSVHKANSVNSSTKSLDECYKCYGTSMCPRLDEAPMLEALVCKKISHERLTALSFHEDCIVTACQEGCVLTWARPGKVPGLTTPQQQQQGNLIAAPTNGVSMLGGTVV